MKQETLKHPENYPEEYITWKVNFFGRDFIVTPDVLIPRLETEGLVRRARNILQSPITSHQLPVTIIDIGCGSGIIWASCADLADEVIFLDISPEALEVAEKNFRTYFGEKKAQFIVSDLLENYLPPENSLLLANLPYIKWWDWKNMSEDTHFEPELALFWGDETGFEIYERLFEQIENMKYRWCMIIEFGFDQREIAEKIIKNYGWKYDFFADYGGIERFCEVIL